MCCLLIRTAQAERLVTLVPKQSRDTRMIAIIIKTSP
jgi:hypothetical protein